jgi:hypothetical protein
MNDQISQSVLPKKPMCKCDIGWYVWPKKLSFLPVQVSLIKLLWMLREKLYVAILTADPSCYSVVHLALEQ